MRKLTHEEIGSKRFSPDRLAAEERFPVMILLDNIRSLYNVGSIFRSADGARVSKLILCGYTPCPPRKEIEKTALGATATVPWSYVRNPLDAIAELKSEGIRICVLEQTGSSKPYYSISKDLFPLCLVVGNEITGVSGEIIREADCAVDIPMYGMKQSLNAAVALGITIFECVRIWKEE
jgi:tRNA G18 (ribose-2'-O)-methylase SpoU